MYNAENLQEKWAPVLNHEGLNDIKDPYRKSVTAILLENQERALAEERAVLTEAPTNVGPINTPTTNSGAVAGFDPILISLIRRAMPKLIAYDIAGVQPMTGPTGLIFAMRSRKGSQTGDETFFDEVDTAFSGQDDGNDLTQGGYTGEASEGAAVGFGTTSPGAKHGTNPGLLNPSSDATQDDYAVGQGMQTLSLIHI